MIILDLELIGLNGVSLDDSLESLAVTSFTFNDDDWLLSFLASLDDHGGSLDDLIFLLDVSIDVIGVRNSDSFLLSDQMSLGLVALSNLDLELLSFNWGLADRDLVSKLSLLDLFFCDSLLNLYLIIDACNFGVDLSDGLL